MAQVQLAVARVVRLQIRGDAGAVEPGVVAREQCAADAQVLPLRPDREERQASGATDVSVGGFMIMNSFALDALTCGYSRDAIICRGQRGSSAVPRFCGVVNTVLNREHSVAAGAVVQLITQLVPGSATFTL